MLAFLVLFTIFVGLVGLLAAIGECQKRRRSSKRPGGDGGPDLLRKVEVWLADHQQSVPTTQQVLALFSDSLHSFFSKVSVGCFSLGVWWFILTITGVEKANARWSN